jgi:hypothetical protein
MLVVPWRRRLLTAATLTTLMLITGCGGDPPADTRGALSDASVAIVLGSTFRTTEAPASP